MGFMRTASSFFLSASIFIIPIYVLALIAVYFLQRSFLYFPSSSYVMPKDANAPAALQELVVKTEDGLELKGWYAPASGKAFTLVFLHGNGDSLATAAPVAAPYIAAGYGFLVAEYRGYSGLRGKPTEQGLYWDGRAYLKALLATGVKEENIILFGYSLGSGVATQMATEFHVGGLILLAPFLSMAKMAQVRFPFFPAEYLTIDRIENFKKIPTLHVPVLMGNGGRDEVIPPSQGRDLFASAHEPKQFYFAENGGHTDLFDGRFYEASLSWLDKLGGKSHASK